MMDKSIHNKIGLVTMYRNNYGSILQCYAIKKYLQDNTYDCILLDVERNYDDTLLIKLKKGLSLILNSIRYKDFLKQKINMKKAMSMEITYLSKNTKIMMDNFVDTVLMPQIYSWESLIELGNDKNYIAFITGSDQVWNASRKLDSLFFLEFTKKQKKIALSVSFGIEKIPKYNEKSLKKKILSFDDISVREETMVTIIKKLVDKKVKRLADPTLLLNKDEWSDFCKNIEIKEKNYMLVHFLNEPSHLALTYIRELSLKHNLNVICLGYYYDCYQEIEKCRFIDGNPEDYVKYILEAQMICTDSFHTTLFSINFYKSFYAFVRQYLHDFPQTTRIVDLLSRFGLLDRLIKEKSQQVSILNENELSLVLESERNNIKCYLLTEIQKKSFSSE